MNDEDFKNPKLMAHGARALWNWGKTGFAVVDEGTFQKRVAICLSCPNAMRAPSRLAYRLAQSGEADAQICVFCGCVISHKARLASETCPDQDPHAPGANRWGERPIPD